MNISTPLVSVIIPMYNVAEFICDAIESVLTQSYENFEILCIDDGSPDSSAQLVKGFSDHRVKLVRQKNRGLAGARNTGLNLAKGKYVALLDADDLWHEDKLKVHVEHLEKSKDVDISYCPSLFMDEDGKKLKIGQFPKLKSVNAKDILCRNPVGNGSAAVIRKRLLDEIREAANVDKRKRTEFFDERLRQSEDIEFWLRCALTHYAKFEGVKQPLTYYRINNDGLSANLEKQLSSWHSAMNYNRSKHPRFFRTWFSLAQAYQFRYLARRAIKSGMSKEARLYSVKSLKSSPIILLEEPKRTLNTLACTMLISVSETAFNWLSERVITRRAES